MSIGDLSFETLPHVGKLPKLRDLRVDFKLVFEFYLNKLDKLKLFEI